MKWIKLFEQYTTRTDKVYSTNFLWLVYHFKKEIARADLKQIRNEKGEAFYYREVISLYPSAIEAGAIRHGGKLEIFFYNTYTYLMPSWSSPHSPCRVAVINDPENLLFKNYKELYRRIGYDGFKSGVVQDALKNSLGVYKVLKHCSSDVFSDFSRLMKQKKLNEK